MTANSFSALQSSRSGSGFLADISHSFIEHDVDISGAQDIIVIAGVLLAVLISWYALTRYRQARRAQVPFGTITDPVEIRRMLENTIATRCRYELRFQSHASDRRRLTFCTCVKVDSALLTLECSNVSSTGETWTGRNVEVAFRLPQRHGEVFYGFSSTIAAVHPGTMLQLGIEIPVRLDREQKRQFLRLAPPEALVHALTVWHVPPGLPETGAWSTDDLGEPLLASTNREHEKTLLLNISGGGMRLRFPRECIRHNRMRLGEKARLVVRLALFDPDVDAVRLFWFLTEARNAYIEQATRDMEIGLAFTAFVADASPDATMMEWSATRRDGEVDLVLRWTLRRHLDLYRDHSVE